MSQLFVVGTPIGNLQDLSPRAVETLRSVDFVAAEDTRVTLKLLNHFAIKKPMVSYYEHNLREKGELILSRILSGETCAVVSDAGMPCISDPGEDLVRLCAEHGVLVTVIPGPSAAVSALAVSGLVTSRFTFEGFLSTNKASRAKHLASLQNECRTMIFYEAPHKLLSTLSDLEEAFGADRPLSVCRELTKIHEEILRTTVGGARAHFGQTVPKGEFVLIVSGKKEEEAPQFSLEEVCRIGREMVASGMRATDAAKELAKTYGYKKADLYKALL